MNINDLKNKIISLIETQREDDYWDFKQCHHKNKADLLHDIICMANNRSDNDGYIIFGIQDKTFDIIGVENDDNRRNQQNIIDFLKSKTFFMSIRPKIQLVTLHIYHHDIDVLIVYNTLETPYYVTNEYKEAGRIVRANFIYTRVGDTNTDIDKSADANHIEYLWKKRFGLHLSPFEKLRYNLKQKTNWKCSEESHYNIQNPEYTLVQDDDMDSDSAEFYAYNMSNHSVMYGTISANYFGTTLYKRQIVTLDGGRYTTVVPEWGFIHYDKYHQKVDAFKYFVKDDISYDFHVYLLNEESHEAVYAHNELIEVVLLFDTEDEKEHFVAYVESHIESMENIIADISDNYEYVDVDSPEKEVVIRRLKVAESLKKMQIEFNKERMNSK